MSRNEALDQALDDELRTLREPARSDGADKAEGLALAAVRRGPWFVRRRSPEPPRN